MGQLEKYGLYVLCLVIFLILGVALWGDPAAAAEQPPKSTTETATRRDGQRQPTYDLNDFKELMSSVPRPETGKAPARSAEPKAAEGATPAEGRARTDAANTSKTEAPDGPGREGTPKRAPDAPAARPTHTIASGDTLEEIAKSLGDVRLVAVLLELNPKVSPAKLQIGKPLVLPTASEIAALKSKSVETKGPETKGKETKGKETKEPVAEPARGTNAAKATAAVRTHRIVLGDTLDDLSRRYFGTTKRVDDIKKLNPGVDPTRLRIGQVIRLPAAD